MQYGKTVFSLVISLVLSYASVAFSTSTVATFSDPINTPPPYLFQYQDVTNNATIDGTLTGGYTGLGLNLIFPMLSFEVHSDVQFSITPSFAAPVLGDVNGVLFKPVGGGLGLLEFTELGVPILRIDWNQLHFTTGTTGATDTTPGELVEITVLLPGAAALSDPESFAFSFANQAGFTAAALAGNAATVEATAAFTSSATVDTTAIPEPSTVALLGVGLIGLGLRQGLRRAVKARLI